jgi:sodium transport system permease protein
MTGIERMGVVLRKEVSDNLRDRRSLISALSGSLIGPVILLGLIVVIGKTLFKDAQAETFVLPVIGQERAPALTQFLEQNGAELIRGPADPAAAVRAGDADVVLVIPAEGFIEDFAAGRPATVRLVYDSTRQSAVVPIQRARSLLESYTRQIAGLRLLGRGIDPLVIYPLSIEQQDLATPQTQALIFLNMMPYFVVLVVFVGGMYVIIDATAGERERGSLEPLLINPARRRELVLGKLLAALPFSAFALLLNLTIFGLAFNLIPLEDYIGFQLTLSVPALAGIFLIALPMILLASGLQMIVATYTRSFKEAQTYVSLMALVPALPGLGLAFFPIKPGLLMMLIPTFGQQILINQLMRGEQLNPLFVVVSAAVTLVAAGLLTLIAVRLYERERIMFGAR